MNLSTFSYPDPSSTHYRLGAFKGIRACKTKCGAAILRLAGRPDGNFRCLRSTSATSARCNPFSVAS